MLTENGQAKFAVIPFAACEKLRALLADEEKLAGSFDSLHIQQSLRRKLQAQISSKCRTRFDQEDVARAR
ncbi:MAG: hypothetical protein WAU00_01280 [Caldilinea sp.]